ncbi:cell wall-binding repeat-containing protein [Agromyces albus]|uniref:Cell wall-binding repeat-containing protein n=1 Tax=Agromyces albus TaxID=205332 RepID=A0A4Q2L442_9MICO|nr:cell wall-binding repeat-containing protein [Agromyces albus]RXZ72964.1 cell wall-binding repeat-containing protein [Agromyces albus]
MSNRPSKAAIYAVLAAASVATLLAVGFIAPVATTDSAEAAELHSISGHVGRDDVRLPTFGIPAFIQVYRAGSDDLIAWGESSGSGDYTIAGIPDGEYQLRYSHTRNPDDTSLGYASMWFGGTPYHLEATVVTLAGEDLRADIDLPIAGAIAGRINAPWTAPGNDLVAWAYLIEPDGALELVTGWSGTSGAYQLRGLPAGSYLVKFTNGSGGADGAAYRPEWWPDVRLSVDADEVHVVSGSTTPNIDAWLSPWQPAVIDRVAGADRFEAAAAMSAGTFEPGVPVVMVANGLNFPDALSAGPAAAVLGGPVLLVTPSAIPPSIGAELERLAPQRIVVVGGPASVSEAVLSELSGFATTVERITGGDRYEVSRNVAAYAFSEPSMEYFQVLFADGRGFADALSAGAAAANSGFPLVLVNGGRPELDAETKSLLTDLHPFHTWIIGGPNSVHSGFDDSLRSNGFSTQRIGGADRFAVSAGLTAYFSVTNHDEIVFFATGFNFPDALAGAPVAAATRANLLLVPRDCVPIVTLQAMQQRSLSDVVLLGGPASLGSGVENLIPC